jgi:hypothetical protein
VRRFHRQNDARLFDSTYQQGCRCQRVVELAGTQLPMVLECHLLHCLREIPGDVVGERLIGSTGKIMSGEVGVLSMRPIASTVHGVEAKLPGAAGIRVPFSHPTN